MVPNFNFLYYREWPKFLSSWENMFYLLQDLLASVLINSRDEYFNTATNE